jgi:hypothetical protein
VRRQRRNINLGAAGENEARDFLSDVGSAAMFFYTFIYTQCALAAYTYTHTHVLKHGASGFSCAPDPEYFMKTNPPEKSSSEEKKRG